MKNTLGMVAVLIIGLAPYSGHAAPILSIDMDPATVGVQDSLFLDIGASFTVDIVIDGVDAGQSLNGFELDLDFDPTAITASLASVGSFLLAPSLVFESDLNGSDINLAAVTLLPTGATGFGILASITFEALAAGTSALVLNDLLLSAPFGIPIGLGDLNDGTVTVRGGAIPEPGSLWLFLVGLAGLGGLTGRKGFRRFSRP